MTRRADMTGNRVLAVLARELADEAGRGTLDRRAALCCAVILDESRSAASARKLLGDIRDPDIRQAAADLLGQLTTEGDTTT